MARSISAPPSTATASPAERAPAPRRNAAASRTAASSSGWPSGSPPAPSSYGSGRSADARPPRGPFVGGVRRTLRRPAPLAPPPAPFPPASILAARRHEGLIVDNFAGGGGASTGIEEAHGRPIDLAINHDAEAIAMHQANHPG